MTHKSRAALGSSDPDPCRPRGIVTNMLGVPAFENRNPVTLIVLSKRNDPAFWKYHLEKRDWLRANGESSFNIALTDLLGPENANVAEVAVLLGVIQAVPDHELIGNTEAYVGDIDRAQAAFRLVEQRCDPDRFRFALL
jgi:hypothetical protein